MGLKNKKLLSNSWPAVRIVTNQKHQKENQANDHITTMKYNLPSVGKRRHGNTYLSSTTQGSIRKI